MERITEPELMNNPEQVLAYAQADFSNPHALFIERFRQCFPNRDITGRVLELGCGPADISMRFAMAFSDCTIDAVDGAGQMLKLAQENLQRENLQERIRLVESRLQDMSLPCDNYEVVISNSLLHHLHDPAVLWDCIKDLGKDGLVFVMDLMRPETREDAGRLVQEYAADEPDILQRDFFHSLCAAFRPGEIRAQITEAGLGMLTVEVVSDRHLIIYGALN